MKIHYISRLMPEFNSENLPENGQVFHIVRISDYGDGNSPNVIEDEIVDSSKQKYNYLTEQEAASLAAELMRKLSIKF